MKIIHFNSGLGNQIFQFMFAQYMKKRGERVYGYYNKKWLQQHNGLEVDKVIVGEMPPATIFSNFVVSICRALHKFDKKGRFFSSDSCYNPNGIYYSGYWQDKKYFEHLPKPIFQQINLSDRNKEIVELINSCNSVSIHVRRGDYLSQEMVAKMGNICTLDYYKNAIELIKRKISNPVFFVFSDDIEWVKKNLLADNMHLIDWNSGNNSFIDMFLMSECKAHVIANSSFSYWGAYMSKINIVTVYPHIWFNDEPSPNIALEDWVAL